MTNATAFRGQPLLVFAGVLCAWFALRIALWQPLHGIEPSHIRDLDGRSAGGRGRPAPTAVRRAVAPSGSPAPWSAPSIFAAVSSGSRPVREVLPVLRMAPLPRGGADLTAAPRAAAIAPADPVRLAVGHNLLLAAGLAQIELPLPLAAYLRGPARSAAGVPAAAPFVIAWPKPMSGVAGPRLAADAWLMFRQDTASSVVSGRPSYGRSQAGAVVRYRLARSSRHALQAYIRASSALEGALETDLAAGLSGRPLAKVPLRVAAEARISQTGSGTELRPAVMAVTEFPPLDLPLGARAGAYIQGGYVGGRFATPFVDGQGRVERQVALSNETGMSAGAGVWGGAQKGAARLDVGPTVAITFRLGGGRGRVAMDYRFRVSGDAEPRSGAALTLSAGF